MKIEKQAKTVLCIVFLLMLVLPLIFTNFKPGTLSETEKRTLSSFPKLFDENGSWNVSFVPEFENWFNDNVGFREKMFEINSIMQYDLLHSVESDQVLAGKDGWLFYKGNSNIEIATGKYPNFDESVLADICWKQQQIQKKLAEQGIEYVIFLPPSKVSIYPEYLRGSFEIRKTPVDILADYLEAHSELKVIRLKGALLEEKSASDDLLFYKTDTHWNGYGSYVGYCKIVRQLNEWGIIDSEPVQVDFFEASAMRDLTNMIAINNEKYYETSIERSIRNPMASLVREGEKYECLSAYGTEQGASRVDYYLNSNQSLPSFLVLGDSMFMDHLADLFAENSSEMMGIWQYSLTQKLLDMAEPDVVFFEMTERLLNSMGTQSGNFIHTTITVHEDENYVDIIYWDGGSYSQMWFPTWSEENGQDDVIWYEAERLDETSWHVRVDLSDHNSAGTYIVHFYQGIEAESKSYVLGDTFEVTLQ